MSTFVPFIAYHGLGYVGLTGAVHLANAGVDVVGYDPDQEVVDAINAGAPRAGDFLQYLGGVDYRAHFQATTDFDRVAALPVHILAVPSEKDGEPWMALVYDVIRRLADTVNEGTLIIVESTLQPGAIDALLSQHPTIQRKLDGGELFLSVCPRRDWFADPDKNLSTLFRVVGGYNDASTTRTVDVLTQVTPAEKILTTTYRTAELTKALENAMLHVPVMMCHELAATYPTLDVAEAAKLASTHWRFQSLGEVYLGFGSGGRCVPLGSKYLTSGAPRRHPPMILEKALAVDKAFPALVADVAYRRAREIAKGRQPVCLLLGVAYRPGFRDLGLSPGLRVAQMLDNFGAAVHLHDAVFTPDEIRHVAPYATAIDAVPQDGVGYDVILLSTPHQLYLDLPATWTRGPAVIDARGVWAQYQNRFSSYAQVGTPDWSRPF